VSRAYLLIGWVSLRETQEKDMCYDSATQVDSDERADFDENLSEYRRPFANFH
jgi:hypothetical protein